MAKTPGSTRASASNNPRGLTAAQENIIAVNARAFSQPILGSQGRISDALQEIEDAEWRGTNGIYSISTENGRAGVSYMPLDGGYNVIVNGEIHEEAFSEDLATAQGRAKEILIAETLRKFERR